MTLLNRDEARNMTLKTSNMIIKKQSKSVLSKAGINDSIPQVYRMRTTSYFRPLTFVLLLLISASFLSSCKVYSFKNVTIPPEVKTIKIGFIQNKARYINPQLSPRLTDRVQQKISNQTRLTRTNNDDADWIVNGTITQYDVTTTGISNQQASINRLTVSVHIVFKSTLANTTQEFDATRNFDFSANRTLQEAEPSLNEEILRNLSDEIFNRLFSNW